MQIVLIGLVVAIFLHDVMSWRMVGDWSALGLLVVWLGPKATAAAGYALVCRRARRRLRRDNPLRILRRVERYGAAYNVVLVLLYMNDLAMGVLDQLRTWLTFGAGGDIILIDEVIFLTPTLLAFAWAWWCYYPMDRRLREAALMRRVDQGLPVGPIWTRGKYVLNQFRHQVALILIPLLLMLGWVELIESGPVRDRLPTLFGYDAVPLFSFAGTAAVFLFAPLIIRYLWDTTPLPAGEVREHMLSMCRRHGVGVRDVLVWRTAGGMINAAVMGLISPLRYILLTDALLETVRREEVEAVMAHELGHVRRHHMFWLLTAAITGLGILELVFGAIIFGAAVLIPMLTGWMPFGGAELDWQWLQSDDTVFIATAICTFPAWFLVFGWVSRRIERQADTFAVQHLNQTIAERGDGASSSAVVSAEAVDTMVGALQRVADLNHMSVKRHNWRHGSIAWRQGHLRSLVGRPVDRLPIDRQMKWIKLATIASLLTVTVVYSLMTRYGGTDSQHGYNPRHIGTGATRHALHEDARDRERLHLH